MNFSPSATLEASLANWFEQITELTHQIHSEKESLDVLNTTVQRVRNLFQCDRAIIYQLLPHGDGIVIAESVDVYFTPILGRLIYDPCFAETLIEVYRKGKISQVNNIDDNALEFCYLDLLKQFEIKANLAVPIIINSFPKSYLWGLLILHQCQSPRQWQPLEIKALQNIALQLGIVLEKLNHEEINQITHQTYQKQIKERQEYILAHKQREQEKLRWKEALLRSMTDTSRLAFYVVDNRTDKILYLNHRFCEIWQIETLENKLHLGELKNNDIIPHCISLIADLPTFIESCKPLQSEENRSVVEDEISFTDGRIIRRFSSQIRDDEDNYFGRLYIFEDITKRKQLEIQVQEYKDNLRKLTQMIPGAICQFRLYPDGHKTMPYASEGIREIYEVTPDEIKEDADVVLPLLHPDDIPQIMDTFQVSAETLTQYHLEHRVILPKKGLRWLEVNSMPEVLADGSILWHGYILDVTERKQLQEEVKESEEKYRSLITSMAEGIVFQEKNGQIIACNQSAERILGLTEAQITGRTSIDPHWQAIYEDGSPFLGENHPAMVTLRTGEAQMDVIMGIHQPDDQLTWISINSQPLFYPESNEPYAVVTSFQDITEKRTLEIALQQNEALFRGIFEQAKAGIAIVNPSGEFIKINQRFCEMLGYSEQELQSMTFLDITHPDDYDSSINYHSQIVLQEISTTSTDKRYLNRDGSTIWVNLTASSICDLQGNLQYGLGVIIDISDRKKMEYQIQYQSEKERMMYNITQDIRKSLDLSEILNTTVAEVREFLETDRVIIYQVNPDWSGIIVAESVLPQWLSILNTKITDSYLVETQCGHYHNGNVNNITDVYQMNFSQCHIELLEWLQVRAKLVVPIVIKDKIWGLLIAHHCRNTRHWELIEEDLLTQLSNQLVIAIEQSQLHQKVQELALVDGLTKVYNRYHFEHYLPHEWNRLIREKHPLSLILCDIDYFKKYNDSYGHPAGDDCLKKVAQAIKKGAKRNTDLVFRYGGEEFVIILPNTNEQGAINVAKRLQKEVNRLKIPHQASLTDSYVTLSLGIATLMPHTNINPIELINQADQALYKSKEKGRNQFTSYR